MRLLTSNFNPLYEERRIGSTIGKKIEGNMARVGRPDGIRLGVRIERQRRRRVGRNIDQPQTARRMLTERIERQALRIGGKRELLIVDDRIEAADGRAVSRIPLQQIEDEPSAVP